MQLKLIMGRMTLEERGSFCEQLINPSNGKVYSPDYIAQIATGAQKVSEGADKSTVRLASEWLCEAIEDLTRKLSNSSSHHSGIVYCYDMRPDKFEKSKKKTRKRGKR